MIIELRVARGEESTHFIQTMGSTGCVLAIRGCRFLKQPSISIDPTDYTNFTPASGQANFWRKVPPSGDTFSGKKNTVHTTTTVSCLKTMATDEKFAPIDDSMNTT